MGDQATLFGFKGGVSTRSFVENEGAAGFKGLTLHTETGGVSSLVTFAGKSQAMADAHFSVTTGTLLPGTAEAVDYLLVQFNR